MGQNTSRRSVLQGLVTSAIVIGFDLTTRSWVTSASGTSVFESLPSLDGVLYTDNADSLKTGASGGRLSRTVLAAPPYTWKEHWFEHQQLLSLVYHDNDVAVYFDKDVSRFVTWPFSFMSAVWRYTKSVYSTFGSDPRLYAIYHTNKYSGGHPSTWLDASHDYRNVIDVGPGPWTSGTRNDLDICTHEVAHIVEGASKGKLGSPAFSIWGDSKWAEIFIYDVYLGLGRTSDAKRWYDLMMNTRDNFPRANTQWFKNWFYPIYSEHGKSATLNSFFQLLSDHFPKNGYTYARQMNWGEFVYFWSRAAKTNLKYLAINAFGWTADMEAQFNQAQHDYRIFN